MSAARSLGTIAADTGRYDAMESISRFDSVLTRPTGGKCWLAGSKTYPESCLQLMNGHPDGLAPVGLATFSGTYRLAIRLPIYLSHFLRVVGER